MSWYGKYSVILDPPKKCSKCLANLFDYITEDSGTIKMVLESQPNKLKVLKEFLSAIRNKEFIYKILDEEVRRVLT
ncbi:gp091L [Rabbit fibroma virus]|uniref:Gp091L n=1 Tax=Rabbit fibroma virus (strain Kasza) TaxID=10272 RepID=Q9Q8Y7_RFVKA|nr:gp091L [Rabbit fibroma virus]AAF17975.1 gp091L [Rabbit fibroma virus]